MKPPEPEMRFALTMKCRNAKTVVMLAELAEIMDADVRNMTTGDSLKLFLEAVYQAIYHWQWGNSSKLIGTRNDLATHEQAWTAVANHCANIATTLRILLAELDGHKHEMS